MTNSTLCGTPNEVQNLSIVAGQSCHRLNVVWNHPLQLNGDADNIHYMVLQKYSVKVNDPHLYSQRVYRVAQTTNRLS